MPSCFTKQAALSVFPSAPIFTKQAKVLSRFSASQIGFLQQSGVKANHKLLVISVDRDPCKSTQSNEKVSLSQVKRPTKGPHSQSQSLCQSSRRFAPSLVQLSEIRNQDRMTLVNLLHRSETNLQGSFNDQNDGF